MWNSSYHVQKGIKMNDCFMEIGYEAELNTQEHPELLAIAEQECNEHPATRGAAIEELRQMIYDGTLLRIPTTISLLVQRREGTIYDKPGVGRLVIFKLGSWDPNEVPVEDLGRAGMLVTEIGLRQPKFQVLGGTIIADLEGVTLRHMANLTPTAAYQIVQLLGGSTPARPRGCHFINYSWMINTFFYIFKQFIPRSFMGMIHFHGNDLKSLHKHIDPACLPPNYGGTCRYHDTFGTWLSKIKKYRDKAFDKDMKLLGYVVKE